MSSKVKSKLSQGVLDSLHKKHEQIVAQKELINTELETAYKNILWIDDRDDNDSRSDVLTWMSSYCEQSTCMYIEPVDLFREAVDRIVHNSSQYDLVIFDINLKNGFDEISDDQKKEIEKLFTKYHIRFEYEKVDHMHAGYYLFKLLLSVGYPMDRMLIFSGHATKDKAQEELQDIIIDKHIYIPKEKGKLDIESKFFAAGSQDYYRIRRLVYQACAYWDKQIKQIENISKFPFNKLYSLEIDKRTFSGMLEHIKMLFPVKQPSNPQSVYYRAMQIVAAFHEESAKIEKVKDKKGIFKYHSLIRTFRNWSAHNKFEKNELSANAFKLLFCIALRTYFDNQGYENQGETKHFTDGLFDYESILSFSLSAFPKDETIQQMWQDEILPELKLFDERKNKLIDSLNVSDVICRLGEQSEKKRTETELLFILLNESINTVKPLPSKFKVELDANRITFCYEIKFNYANLFDEAKISQMRECERLFLQTAAAIIFPS